VTLSHVRAEKCRNFSTATRLARHGFSFSGLAACDGGCRIPSAAAKVLSRKVMKYGTQRQGGTAMSDTSEEVREAIKLVSRMSFGINRANGMEYEYLHNMLERYAELLEQHEALEARAEKQQRALVLTCKRCDCIHHEKKHRHNSSEPCPVEKIIQEALR
jgi:hypothetical protein